MDHKLKQIEQNLRLLNNVSQMKTYFLYPGIELSFLTLKSERLAMSHDALEHVMEINYCRRGRLGWKMKNGNTVYLGPGDFVLHTMTSCSNSVMTLPTGFYEGLTFCIDLNELTKNLPEPLKGTGITGRKFHEKFCRDGALSSFAGTLKTSCIFTEFYEKPKALQLSYWKLKTLELLLYLASIESSSAKCLTEYQSKQIEVIRKVHDQLAADLSKKYTIETLSKQYLMSSTTLKSLFKAVYGTSIAAHMKEHRMERAAALLLETSDSIAAVARAVGYTSQSKFTAVFKEYYQALPTEYRKQH